MTSLSASLTTRVLSAMSAWGDLLDSGHYCACHMDPDHIDALASAADRWLDQAIPGRVSADTPMEDLRPYSPEWIAATWPDLPDLPPVMSAEQAAAGRAYLDSLPVPAGLGWPL